MHDKLEAIKRTIGRRVRAARRAADINQEELAAKIGRSAVALSNIERGASLTPLETLLSISVALNTPLATFFDDLETEKTPRRTQIEAEIAILLRSLNDAELATALRLLHALSHRDEK